VENENKRTDSFCFLPGIPFAFREAGFGAGLVLLFGISFITDYSLKLMIECAHLTNAFTYQGIMEAAYGRKGFLLLSVLQFIYPFIGKTVGLLLPRFSLVFSGASRVGRHTYSRNSNSFFQKFYWREVSPLLQISVAKFVVHEISTIPKLHDEVVLIEGEY